MARFTGEEMWNTFPNSYARASVLANVPIALGAQILTGASQFLTGASHLRREKTTWGGNPGPFGHWRYLGTWDQPMGGWGDGSAFPSFATIPAPNCPREALLKCCLGSEGQESPKTQ